MLASVSMKPGRDLLLRRRLQHLISVNTLRSTNLSEYKLCPRLKGVPLFINSSLISFTWRRHLSQLIVTQLARSKQCFETQVYADNVFRADDTKLERLVFN